MALRIVTVSLLPAFDISCFLFLQLLTFTFMFSCEYHITYDSVFNHYVE